MESFTNSLVFNAYSLALLREMQDVEDKHRTLTLFFLSFALTPQSECGLFKE